MKEGEEDARTGAGGVAGGGGATNDGGATDEGDTTPEKHRTRPRLGGWVVAVVAVLAIILAFLPGRPAAEESAPALPDLSKVTAGMASSGPGVALLDVVGPITTTASATVLGVTSGASSDRLVPLLEQAEKDADVRAVVIHLDTPGGSAVASDLIGQAIARVRAAGKPVYAVMGDMAASGGYWIAASTERIYANPSTFTGSIGVIMQFTGMYGLFDKIGLSVETVKSDQFKDIGSPYRPMTEEERALMQEQIDKVFSTFVEHVANGRHLPVEQVRRLATGQVYLGSDAVANGLVDELGTSRDALDAAAKAAGLGEGYRVIRLRPNPFSEWFDTLPFPLNSIIGDAGHLGLAASEAVSSPSDSAAPAAASFPSSGLLMVYPGYAGFDPAQFVGVELLRGGVGGAQP